MLFVRRRASDTVLFTSENNDIAHGGVDMSVFTGEKTHMSNQLASLARRDYFYLNAFWRVNLGMYKIKKIYSPRLLSVVQLACLIVCFNDLKLCLPVGTYKEDICVQCIVYRRKIRGSLEQFFSTFSSSLWFET